MSGAQPLAPAPTLAGRVALVTGASRGIGRAIARRLAAHGAAVIVTASARSAEALESVRAEIADAGGRAGALTADLADDGARAELLARAGVTYGPIDILINNAAAIPAYAPASRMDLAARRTLFEVNLQAPLDLIQQALPGMRARGFGRIVNLTSGTAQQPEIPYPGPAKFIHALTLYGASKAALERCTVGLAAELHGTGIHVNAVTPYKIAVTEGATQIAREYAKTHPHWLESVETMAEATYLLVAGSLTGLVLTSREVMQMTQASLHALDGRTLIGDALTLATVAS